MKKKHIHISFALMACLTFASCGKSGPKPQQSKAAGTEESMTFELNGVAKSYNSCNAALGHFQGLNVIQGIAVDNSGEPSGKSTITIDIYGTSNVQAGQTYTGAQFDDSAGTQGAVVNYFDYAGVDYVPDGKQTVSSVTITSLTSKYIKGTFSAVVYPPGGKSAYSITKGTFTASINGSVK